MSEKQSNGISRRKFLNQSMALSGGLALGGGLVGRNSPIPNLFDGHSGKKPNILFIMTDEFNPDVSGPYGNSISQTPALDRLANQGVTFENCYTNCPLCCPSRLSFISGKYTSRIGVWGNQYKLPSEDYPSIAPVLQNEGYDTILSGKMHFDKTRRYGFRELFPGWENVHKKTGLVHRRAPDDTSVNYGSWKSRVKSFHTGNKNPAIIKHDKNVTQYANRYIKNRSEDDKPFFMIAGYLAPHFPLTMPQKYYDMYKGKIGPPKVSHREIAMQPRNYQQIRRGFGFVDMDADVQVKGRELYYSAISWVDHQIGQLINALDQSEVGENTVVIFTADHGENMGIHGMWWKNNMYDSAARIPLIMRWPKRWKGNQRRNKTCSLVDVNQTILDLAEGEAPSDWDGDSIVPWLDEADYSWKDFAVSEYYAKNTSSGFTMYRTGDYKYVYHSKPQYNYPAEQQFFDMKNDPAEVVNLKEVPDYQEKIRSCYQKMIEELGEDPDKIEARCFKDKDKRYSRTDS